MDKNYYKFKKYKQKYLQLKKKSIDFYNFNDILNRNNYTFNNLKKFNNKYYLSKVDENKDNSYIGTRDEINGFISLINSEVMIGLKKNNNKIPLGKIYNSNVGNEVEFYNNIFKKVSSHKKYKNTFVKMTNLIDNNETKQYMLISELDFPSDIFSIVFNKNNNLGFDIKCSKKIKMVDNKNKSNNFYNLLKNLQNYYADILFTGGGKINNDNLFNILDSILNKYSVVQINNIIQKLENIWSGFVFDNYINMIFIVDNINLSDPFVYKDNNRYMNLFNLNLDQLDTIVKLDNFEKMDHITHKNKKELSIDQLNKLKNNVNQYTFGFINLIFALKSYYIILTNEEINIQQYARKFRIYHKDNNKSFHYYYKQLL